MSERLRPQISSRKQPKQARSNDLITAVLDAAVQVLRTEGAARFTTARVAERAGVSVGSLYQYFPNKASILFRLQSDEWRRTSAILRDILQDSTRPPMERLRTVTHAFLRSECEEAGVRTALGDAAPLYRDAPEAEAARASGALIFRDFVGEALPGVDASSVALASDLVEATLTQVGSRFSEVERTAQEIAEYADAMADMFCAYLARISK
jgi:AcrR family transcriptional regulator